MIAISSLKDIDSDFKPGDVVKVLPFKGHAKDLIGLEGITIRPNSSTNGGY